MITRKKPHYGYPLIYYIHIISTAVFLLTVIILAIVLQVSAIIIFVLIIMLCVVIKFLIEYKKIFEKCKKNFVKKITDLADIKGDEIILDLGTGAGLLSVNLAKKLNQGKVYGIDRWSWYPLLSSRLVLTMIFGSSMKNARRNAQLEKVSEKCIYIKGDFNERLDFNDNYFDLICSSQSLYFITDPNRLKFLLKEVNRVLKKDGKIIFFEPLKTSYEWNIINVQKILESHGYKTLIHHIKTPKRWTLNCILLAER